MGLLVSQQKPVNRRVIMYKQLIKNNRYGDFDNFSKIAIAYFEIIEDKEIHESRYVIVDLKGKNKWRFAGFKKTKGRTVTILLSLEKIKLSELI
jgi:hypothetical protein|tara:strand:+ start:1134 stop:1415 length:282 start_codon:yes stop_codon:yes gene_type:complete